MEDDLRDRGSKSLRKKHIPAYKYHVEITADDSSSYEEKAAELERKLTELGMPPWRVELLMDRYVSNLTISEIAKKRGYLSRTTVYGLLKETVSIAKKMRIKEG